jgi:hypothetical protein
MMKCANTAICTLLSLAAVLMPMDVGSGHNSDFLLPTPVSAAKFRGKLLAYLRERFSKSTVTGRIKSEDRVLRAPSGLVAQQCLNLFNKLGRKRWHGRIEPAYEHANGVFKYAGNRGSASLRPCFR